MTSKRELSATLRAIRAQGWAIETTGGGHLKLIPRSGGPVFTGSTPSDCRAIKNLRALLRRRGARL